MAATRSIPALRLQLGQVGRRSGGQRRGDPVMAVACRSQRDKQLAAFDCARVNGCPGHHPVLAKLFAAGQPGDI